MDFNFMLAQCRARLKISEISRCFFSRQFYLNEYGHALAIDALMRI
jgi:hypothetical protein